LAYWPVTSPKGVRIRAVPRNQHHPTPEERDERVKVELPPDDFIKGVLEAGEHPEEADEEEDDQE
jgi:hypothetical protein